jgi:hypothetical protein
MLCVVLFCVNFLVLFEVLGTLEGLGAYFADVWFERGVHYKNKKSESTRKIVRNECSLAPRK